MKHKLYTLTIAMLLCFTCRAQNFDMIRVRLEVIADSSVLVRKNVMPTMRKYGADSPQMDSLNSLITKFDSTSLAEVKTILGKYGWLGKSQVGERANKALFLTVQHAVDDKVREEYYPLLEASARVGESSLVDMATMKDRLLLANGKKQLYGTQYKLMNGKQVFLPIDNIAELNKRRKKVGLNKLKLPLNILEK